VLHRGWSTTGFEKNRYPLLAGRSSRYVLNYWQSPTGDAIQQPPELELAGTPPRFSENISQNITTLICVEPILDWRFIVPDVRQPSGGSFCDELGPQASNFQGQGQRAEKSARPAPE
jgi:hypothetical protein